MATFASPSETQELVEVTSYAEVAEALRESNALAVDVDALSMPIRGGTVLRIDGDAHRKRRRVLNRLVFRGGHEHFRESVLGPTVARDLREILDGPDADGAARADLVAFATRALTELVAAMIGLEPARSREAAEELFRLQADLDEFPRFKTQLRGAAPLSLGDEERLARAHARLANGKREFVERFFGPALAERRRLFARYEAGEIREADLPNDFLTIVASHADPSFDADPDLPVREAIIDLLHAGTGTSVGAIVHTVDELERWLAGHPEDRERRTDPGFLVGAVNEVLRLHAANPAEIRRAVEDVTLSGGTVIPKGRFAALRIGLANRDTSVFGADADRFDPHRIVPAGLYPYGLAFGSGPHMCYGLPLAHGNDGIDGNLVYVTKALYEAGMRPDPAHAPTFHPGIAHADLRGFESYPIAFARTG